MMRLIQITDCHLYAKKTDTLNGVNVYDTFMSVMASVETLKKPEDVLVFTGDLTEDETAKSYKRLRKVLKEKNYKAYFIPGNHDDYKLLKSKLKKYSLGFATQFIELEECVVAFLNSTKKGEVKGELSQKQYQVVAEANQHSEKVKKPLIVFVHHHLFPVNGFMDRYIVEESQDSLKKITANSNLKAVFCGHVHQEQEIEIDGVKFYSTPSTCYQLTPGCTDFSLSEDLPGFRVIDISTDALSTEVVRVEPLIK